MYSNEQYLELKNADTGEMPMKILFENVLGL